jgi:hypothetical protein
MPFGHISMGYTSIIIRIICFVVSKYEETYQHGHMHEEEFSGHIIGHHSEFLRPKHKTKLAAYALFCILLDKHRVVLLL